jgi:hypothetical protein
MKIFSWLTSLFTSPVAKPSEPTAPRKSEPVQQQKPKVSADVPLPASTPIRREMQGGGTVGSSSNLTAVAGSKGEPHIPAAVSAKLDANPVAKRFTDVIVAMMEENGARIPTNVSGLPKALEKKDPQGMRVLADPKVIDGVRVGVLYASDDKDSMWVDRSVTQMLDLQYWIQTATKDKLISPLSDHWRGLVEVATFWLDASDHFQSKKGLTSHDDQQAAGLAVIDAGQGFYSTSCQATVQRMGSFPGLKSWSQDEVEKLGALLSGTGRGLDAETLITQPASAAARLRDRTGAALAFLDNPAERRAFADALIVLKLADRSRGQARTAVETGKDLGQHRLYSGDAMVKCYRDAVTSAGVSARS